MVTTLLRTTTSLPPLDRTERSPSLPIAWAASRSNERCCRRHSTFTATRLPRDLIPGSSNLCTCKRSRPPGNCGTSKSQQIWPRPSTKRSNNQNLCSSLAVYCWSQHFYSPVLTYFKGESASNASSLLRCSLALLIIQEADANAYASS
jgi:hypothetical protein